MPANGELVVRGMGRDVDIKQQASALTALVKAGAVTPVSLDLSDPSMSFDRYEALGVMLGALGRSCRWWVGDWLIFGEGVYGEKYAQAVEATGLSAGTLQNYAYVARQVPKSRRRIGVPFSVHSEVAPLTPSEQRHWLAVAEREGLTQKDLRARIRDNDPAEHGGYGDRVIESEELRAIAKSIVVQAVGDGFGRYLVPGELIHRLQAVVGEEN